MELRILRGEDFGKENYPGGVRAFLDDKIMGMDRAVYPPEYAGCIENMDARYRKNPRSFVCVMDGEKLAGYVNFFRGEGRKTPRNDSGRRHRTG